MLLRLRMSDNFIPEFLGSLLLLKLKTTINMQNAIAKLISTGLSSIGFVIAYRICATDVVKNKKVTVINKDKIFISLIYN